ncbi:MAG: NUDIX hydrolase [Candidatus Glassbacteria bacterium]
MPGYRVERSKDVFIGRIFTVKLDRLKFENGKEVDMEVVRHGGAAAVVPVKEDGRIVLIRQFRYTVDKYIWEVPAGKFDESEDSVTCALREMEEEVGYRAGEIEKLGSILTTPGFSDERIDIYLARDLEKVQRHLDPDEFIDVVDVPIDEAIDMIENGEIEDSKSIIALLFASRRFSGGW